MIGGEPYTLGLFDTAGNYGFLNCRFYHFTMPLKGGNIDVYNVQLSVEGEVYTVRKYTEKWSVEVYTVSSAVHQPWGV